MPLRSLPVGSLCSVPLSVHSLCLVSSLVASVMVWAPRELCRALLEDLLAVACKRGCELEVVLVAGVPVPPLPDKRGTLQWESTLPPV